MLVVVVVYITTVTIRVTVTVVVLFAFSIARGPLLIVYPGAVPLLAVRTIVVVLFMAAFAIFVVLLIGGTVLLVGR